MHPGQKYLSIAAPFTYKFSCYGFAQTEMVLLSELCHTADGHFPVGSIGGKWKPRNGAIDELIY